VAQREYQRTVPLSFKPKIAGNDSGVFGDARTEIAGGSWHGRGHSWPGMEDAISRPAPSRTATSIQHYLRRTFDAGCAATGIALLAPVFAMIALAIKLDDGGPIFYSQVRVGMGLRRFRLFKFRSMLSNSAGGSLLSAPEDARITRVGRVLRRCKLDELPQLVNVLKGDMQLVGVRPQVEMFVEFYRDEYAELLQSRPGITDVSSLIFRDEAKFFLKDSMEKQYVTRILPIKLEMSLKYARTRTFFSDLEILIRTVLGLPCPHTAWEGTEFDPATQSLPNFISKHVS
jgi:lipopolysaccharide/colanic/teichoic acid biosynthesis glycosyltransferase